MIHMILSIYKYMSELEQFFDDVDNEKNLKLIIRFSLSDETFYESISMQINEDSSEILSKKKSTYKIVNGLTKPIKNSLF